MSRYFDLKTKLKAVRLYRTGKGSSTIGRLVSVSPSQVARWVNQYNKGGRGALCCKNRVVPDTLKKEAVKLVLEKGLSCEQTALECGIGRSSLARWAAMVRQTGDYDVLKRKKKQVKAMGRPRKKKFEEMTELEQLRYENEYLKAENALLKKLKALVEEREKSAKKTCQKPSAN